jgi:hypothetical protein
VHSGQDLVDVLAAGPGGSLAARPVVVAESGQRPVATPGVGVHGGAGGDVVAHEPSQGASRCVGDDGHADPSAARTADLNAHGHKGFRAAGPSAAQPGSNPPTKHSSTSTSPVSGSRSGLTIARRSLCSIIHAVS